MQHLVVLGIQVFAVVLISSLSCEGTPLGRRLGKRSTALDDADPISHHEILVGSLLGNPFKDPLKDTQEHGNVDPENDAENGIRTENRLKDATSSGVSLRDKVLLRQLLDSLTRGQQLISAMRHDTPRTDWGRLLGDEAKARIRFRYRKRGMEHMMPMPESKASARAAFMQARRRMGPEFNPTGW